MKDRNQNVKLEWGYNIKGYGEATKVSRIQEKYILFFCICLSVFCFSLYNYKKIVNGFY